MKASYWIKLTLGIGLIVLLALLGYRLVGVFVDFIGGALRGTTVDDGEYVMETAEPAPTIPAYMQDDSFYDNAGSMNSGE
jgi:hypothetical protein